MDLGSALGIASGGLKNISTQFGVISQNVANATTPGYVHESSIAQAVSAGGVGMGVRSGVVTRDVSPFLQAGQISLSTQVSGDATTSAALASIDAVQGTPGGGTDLASRVGGLQDALSGLLQDPSNTAQQQAVVASAQALTGQINTLAGAYGDARQTAQDSIVTGVSSANAALASIGALSTQITQARAAGLSSADLETQRDAAVQQLSGLMAIKVQTAANGDMTVLTPSGLDLPTHATTGPLSTQPATLQPGSTTSGGGIPPITLNGIDVTSQLQGGSLGANITLRDTTLPTDQAELDEFSQTLSTRFDQQGLTLFSQPDGTVPVPSGPPTQQGYVGYAQSITVNPAVAANPALVRDGTHAVTASATGPAAFTPNPAGGPAGFSDLVTRLLNYGMGTQAQAGVPQTQPAATGLGAAGTLAAPYAAPLAIGALAASLVATQSDDAATAKATLGNSQDTQVALQARVSAASGVSVDTEMSSLIALQSSYAANAKVISTVQALWTQLLQIVN